MTPFLNTFSSSQPSSFASANQQDLRRPAKKQRREVPPCRVTNTEDEMKDPSDPFKQLVDLGPQYQAYKPELGPLSRRVDTTYLEGIYSDHVDLDETNYWFTEPEGGWNSENLIGMRAELVETEQNSSAHYGPGRLELHELEEGSVTGGIVTCLMYYHGVQVDIGAQHDGLIPVRQEQWVDDHFRSKYGVSLGVSEDFYVGQAVKVRIHRINDRPRCRFPVQLEVLFPDVQHKLVPPDDFIFPFDLRGVTSREEVFRITGRPWVLDAPDQPYLDTDELKQIEWSQRVPELSAASYGEKEVNFDDIHIWDKDVMEMLDSQNMEFLEDDSTSGEGEVNFQVLEDADIYEEVA